MPAPNLANTVAIFGKSNVALLTTTSTTFINNPPNSGKTFKINTIMVSNVDLANHANVTVGIVKFGAQNTSTGTGNTYYNMIYNVVVPSKSSLDILGKTLYLEEGDHLKANADAANRLQLVASFEEIN